MHIQRGMHIAQAISVLYVIVAIITRIIKIPSKPYINVIPLTKVHIAIFRIYRYLRT
jgi:hypothetical protein